MPAPATAVDFSTFPVWPGPALGSPVGTLGPVAPIDRESALSVPAVSRGVRLIAGQVAGLPLEQVAPGSQVVRSPLLEQIDPHTPSVVTIAQTVTDLILDGVSFWRVTARDAAGWPVSARHLDVEAVTQALSGGLQPVASRLPSGLDPLAPVEVAGERISPGDVIRFDSPFPGALTSGARPIRRALKLAQLSELLADDPDARAYWRTRDGSEPTDDELSAFLSQWAAARRARTEAFVPSALERVTNPAPSAADLQLSALLRQADLDIANVLGLDPEDLGLNTTSRTYQNSTDRNRDRVNTLLAPYMAAITGRLSLGDITPRGHVVRFRLADLLRADDSTRWANYAVAAGLGAMTLPEIRAAEGLPALPVVPPAITPPGGSE